MSEFEPGVAIAREDLCRFLSACYYQPGPEFAEERLFHSMLDAAERIDPQLAALTAQLRDAFEAQEAQALLVDYTRLFLGPGQPLARPHGSFWLSGEPALMQPATLDVLELYREGGFEVDESVRELPDHVALELEFLYLLTFKRNEAQRTGDTGEAAAAELLERRLLGQHLGAWAGRFAAAVKAGAHTPFYGTLAELTERFVRMEEARLA